jgi:hypothetical protein
MSWCHETIDVDTIVLEGKGQGNKQVATGPKTFTRVLPAKFSIGGVAQILRTRAVSTCDLGLVKKFQ